MPPLVLSLFPGVDLLGRAFHANGFAVVTGPDLLLDGRIEDFHVPAGRFDGVIGGPPCTNYSDANRRRDTAEGDRLVTHFLRIVLEAQPTWWLMENVRNVPDVRAHGYTTQRLDITDAACGGKQRRLRHIQFGHREGWIIRPPRTNGTRSVTPALTCRTDSPHDRHARRLERQGFAGPTAPKLPLRALTSAARIRAIGNGVPWRVGCALAVAVHTASSVTEYDCQCGCGRPITEFALAAYPACRKRLERSRRNPRRIVECAPGSVTVPQPLPEITDDRGTRTIPITERPELSHPTNGLP